MQTIRKTAVWAGLSSLAMAFTLALSPAAQAEDLWDVYQLAAENDPVIREARANRDAALENKPQALANLLPQVSASGSMTRSDTGGLSADTSVDLASGDINIVRNPKDSENKSASANLTITQSVFDWRNWVRLQQADDQVARAEADFQAAQQQLLQRVVQRYFDVLAAQDELQAVRSNKEALARQLEQTKKRFEVGLIAITDVQESQAAYDTAVANEIGAERTLATAREALRELTGVYVDDLEAPEGEIPLMRPDPEKEEAWVEAALEQNLSLVAARLATDISRQDMMQARGNLYPTLDLSLRLSKTDSEFTSNTFFNQFKGQIEPLTFPDMTETTSMQLSLNVPIWSGGRNYSQLRQASHQHTAAKERAIQTHRQVERETRDAYLGVLSEISRVRALRQALESNQTAMQATEAGFEVGTRTTVDVLNARQALTRARTNYFTSRYDYIRTLVQLKLAAGSLNQDDLQQIDAWLEQ